MSFQITEIIDAKPDGLIAQLRHQDHRIQAVIPNKRKDDVIVGAPFRAGIGFDRILNWQILDDFDDTQSGIWQGQDGIHLRGRVHNVLDYGDGKIIVDVYMQNGSELFTVDAETIDDVPEANSGLEITVGNLYIYPIDQ